MNDVEKALKLRPAMSFDEVYAETKARVKSIARRYATWGVGEDDDIEQEIWIRIAKDLPTWDRVQPIGSFVWVRARSVACNYKVRESYGARGGGLSLDAPGGEEVSARRGNFVDGQAVVDARLRLANARRMATEELTPIQLGVFRCMANGMNASQAAKEVGVSEARAGVVRERVRKALRDMGV